jgi:branched-chain amino acid transport system ATP-binding protein
MLSVDKINTFYGKLHILKDVSLKVGTSELISLIGANGAGKSTLLNTISGIVSPVSGQIEFMGERIDGLKTEAIVECGVVHVPEGRRVFPHMSVIDNLMMGAYSLKGQKSKIRSNLQKVLKLFPVLAERKKQMAGTLSGGEQQMLATGRGLMVNPKVFLLDEPSLGLAPMLVEIIFDVIEQINNEGTAVMLIEQNAEMALNLAHRAYVLEIGQVVLSGKADKLISDEGIRKAFLGGVR